MEIEQDINRNESVDVNNTQSSLTSGQASSDLISLSNLLSFFSAPQRYFLENTLGIHLKDQGETLDDCEPFSLDYLENYNLKDEMLNRMIKGSDIKIDTYRAKGVLPHGTAGAAFFEDTVNKVKAFYTKINQYVAQGRSESIEVDITGNGWRLKGIVADIWGDRLVRFRIASVKPKDILRAWIIHLSCLCSPKCKIDINSTLLIGSDKHCYFTTPEEPLAILDSLIKLYKHGIKTPLRFFPAASKVYAEGKGIEKAEKEFQGNNISYTSNAEGQSEEVKLCFRHLETPLDNEFCSLSNSVWLPVIEHLECN
ncbi:MAG: hypothetical protein HQK73_02915 [Desulfamplus sp.]|nr:hypothetical protein [Desulfamplus sp.]